MAIGTLDKQTSASTVDIQDLLGWVQDGVVRVPDFQRSFRWGADDVLLLVDSVLREYPIGTLLFWEQPAPEQTLHFGAWTATVAARPDARWVVDGQQRIHSLVATLLGPVELGNRYDKHALFFDLERRVVLRRQEERSLHQVPLPVLADTERLLAWLYDYSRAGGNPGHHAVAIATSRRLREYRIPAYVVRGADSDTARRIFVRLNTSGLGMRAEEVFRALEGAVQSSPNPLDDFGRRLADTGFGTVPPKTLLVAVAAVAGLDLVARLDRQLPRVNLPETLPLAEAACRRAARFLIDDAQLPHIRLLPFQFVFTLLVSFFHHHPDPHPRTRQLLARVVWRGILGQSLRGTAAGDVARLVKACALPEAECIVALLAGTPLASQALPTGAWVPRSLATRALFAALLRHEPRALVDLAPRDDGALAPSPGGSVRAGSVLSPDPLFGHRLSGLREGTSTEPGACLLHPPVRQPVAAVLAASAVVAASHGFDDTTRALLAAGRMDEAVARRSQWMHAQFVAFATLRCALAYNDAPAIETLRP